MLVLLHVRKKQLYFTDINKQRSVKIKSSNLFISLKMRIFMKKILVVPVMALKYGGVFSIQSFKQFTARSYTNQLTFRPNAVFNSSRLFGNVSIMNTFENIFAVVADV